MPKEEWGVKRSCPKCATRFYDLLRDPMICPSCGHEFTLESLTAPAGRSQRIEKQEVAETAAKPEAAEADVDVDVLDDEDEDDTDVDLGDDVLEEDDDDTVDLDDLTDVPADDDEN